MARKAKPVKRGRRKRGTGTVVQRKDGRWQWSYLYNGKRYTGYASSYEEADRLVLEAIASVGKHGFVSERTTVGEWLKEWMSTKRRTTKATTNEGWDRIIRVRLIPALGKVPLSDLKRRDVQALVNSWSEEGLSPSTVRAYFAPLHISIISAIQEDILTHNPCDYIRFPRKDAIEEEEEEANVLTIEQSRLLLSELEGHWSMPIFILALATGLRKGELIGLRWSDIQLQTSKLQVRRNAAWIGGVGYVEDTPKSKSSKRTISLPGFACDMLKQHRTDQIAKRLQASAWADLDLVFCRKDGTHIREASLDDALESALRRAGLPKLSMHDLRHSAASILIALGIEITVVSKILGHANPGITMSIYAHMLPGRDDDAMIRYNQAFLGIENKKAN